jgi:hypothetical protein
MPSKIVSDAFEAHLATWANFTACPFVDVNEVSNISKPPFIEIEYPVSMENRISVGKPAVYRESGGARFVITVALFKPGWKAQVQTWIEELRDLFRSQSLNAGVETYEVSSAVFDDANKNGNRYRIPFVVRFTFDSIK